MQQMLIISAAKALTVSTWGIKRSADTDNKKKTHPNVSVAAPTEKLAIKIHFPVGKMWEGMCWVLKYISFEFKEKWVLIKNRIHIMALMEVNAKDFC